MPNAPDQGSSSLFRYRDEILKGNRVALSQAITLTESSLEADRAMAESLIGLILPQTGNSIRIGITGIPGVGKSTFIEAFGKYLTGLGKKIAILTIDPSSAKTKGSILGDKTRMEELSKDPLAFIRPTASGNFAGGVAGATRESVLLCEAAGFEIILIETVGVGQSETAVRSMVDFFLLLQLGGAGDELQGIKKGIMEMADGIVITKADGNNAALAKQAQSDFKNALHLFQLPSSGVLPEVLITSALEKKGLDDCWRMIKKFVEHTKIDGFFTEQRNQQQVGWFYDALDQMIKHKILDNARGNLTSFEKDIVDKKISPINAARQMMEEIMKFTKG